MSYTTEADVLDKVIVAQNPRDEEGGSPDVEVELDPDKKKQVEEGGEGAAAEEEEGGDESAS